MKFKLSHGEKNSQTKLHLRINMNMYVHDQIDPYCHYGLDTYLLTSYFPFTEKEATCTYLYMFESSPGYSELRYSYSCIYVHSSEA